MLIPLILRMTFRCDPAAQERLNELFPYR